MPITRAVAGSRATVLVLSGGGSRRMGADKTAAGLGATTVLDHLLDALPADWPVVVVGPERPTRRAVRWTRESPPGGGPVAAVAAGLALVDTELVLVLAGDMPFAADAAAALATNLRRDATTDAAVAADTGGRSNPLLAAYRTAALRQALPDRPRTLPPARCCPSRIHPCLSTRRTPSTSTPQKRSQRPAIGSRREGDHAPATRWTRGPRPRRRARPYAPAR